MTDPIANLRALLEKATPGPWKACRIGEEYRHGGAVCTGDAQIVDWVRSGKNDQALIVAAVNALPKLLAVAQCAQEVADYWAKYDDRPYAAEEQLAADLAALREGSP